MHKQDNHNEMKFKVLKSESSHRCIGESKVPCLEEEWMTLGWSSCILLILFLVCI